MCIASIVLCNIIRHIHNIRYYRSLFAFRHVTTAMQNKTLGIVTVENVVFYLDKVVYDYFKSVCIKQKLKIHTIKYLYFPLRYIKVLLSVPRWSEQSTTTVYRVIHQACGPSFLFSFLIIKLFKF